MKSITPNNVKFSNLAELMEFLYSTPEYNEWEVCKFEFITSDDTALALDLSPSSILLNREFIEFSQVSDKIYDFYLKYKHLSLTFNIKFKVPYYLKNSIDSNNVCENFYLDFYSSGNLNIMTPTFVERGRNFNNPIGISWIIYALNIVQEWYNKKLINK